MKKSAGILLYQDEPELKVLLVHPGGPYFTKKDLGVWSIPKGEYTDEDPKLCALREFEEELGSACTSELKELGEVTLKSGKQVTAFYAKGSFDCSTLKSNLFSMEWPKGSSKYPSFPEVDKAEWFTIDKAREKISPAQEPLLDNLLAKLS